MSSRLSSELRARRGWPIAVAVYLAATFFPLADPGRALESARWSQDRELVVGLLELPGSYDSAVVSCSLTAETRLCQLLILVRDEAPTEAFSGQGEAGEIVLGVGSDSEPGDSAGDETDPDEPADRTLYRLVLAEGSELEPWLHLDVAEEDSRLYPSPSIDLLEGSGQGDSLVVVQHRGAVHLLPLPPGNEAIAAAELPPPATRTRVDDPPTSGPWNSWQLLDRRQPVLILRDVGSVEVRSVSDHRSRSLARRHPLPVSVERRRDHLELISPPVQSWGRERARYAIGPEAHGATRLRTRLLEPLEAPSPETTRSKVATDEPLAPPDSPSEPPPQERWSRLPGIERVIASRYLSLGGEPYLAVFTLRADRVGMLERKKLRIFDLRYDRTRRGAPPVFETLSASRMWQRLDLEVVDADGDGRLDVVLVQPEGLGGNKLAIDLYRARAGGEIGESAAPAGATDGSAKAARWSLDAKPLRSMIQEKDAWFRFGVDWNGDGRPDLLAVADRTLSVYPGRDPDRRGFLERQPRVRHRFESGLRAGLEARGRDSYGLDGPWVGTRVFEEAGILWVVTQGGVADTESGGDRLELVLPSIGTRDLADASLVSQSFSSP